MIDTLISTIGVAGLGAFVVRFVLTRVWVYLERQAANLERQAERQHELLTNHLAHNTKAIEGLTVAINRLMETLGG